jgi:hypothetical protein
MSALVTNIRVFVTCRTVFAVSEAGLICQSLPMVPGDNQ